MNPYGNGFSSIKLKLSVTESYGKLHQQTIHLLTRLNVHNSDKIISLHK